MLKLRLIVLERDVRQVARALGELGVVHLRSSVEETGRRLQPESLDQELANCRALAERARNLMELLGVTAAAPSAGRIPQVRMEQAEKAIAAIEQQTSAPAARLADCQRALADTDALIGEIFPFRQLKSPLRPLTESAFLEVRAGAVAPDELEPMRAALPDGVLAIPLAEASEEGEGVDVLVICPRPRPSNMVAMLEQHGFVETPLPGVADRAPAEVYQEALGRRQELEESVRSLDAELHRLGQASAEALRDALHAVSAQVKLYEAAQNFGGTWATAVISGWIPAVRADALRGAVMRATDGRAVLDLAEPGPEDIGQGRVPSYIVHSRLLAPFERLVSGYGVASYTEIEPTLLFAVSFLLMFGVIFGDVGDGLCLFAAGLLANRRGKTAGFRDVGYVIAAAGLVSMVFGLFFQGSLFGKSLLDMGFPLTLGYEPIRFEGGEGSASTYVMRYLVLAMLFGVVLISAGAVLNMVNLLRRRDYGRLLLDRFGVVGIVFYWGALALAIKIAVAGSGKSDVWLAAGVLGVPLVVLALHAPLHALLTHHRPIWGESPIVSLFEGIIEALETAVLYVANTFSFLRVAAFALSHAALSFTIFVLQQLVNGLPGGPVWSGAVFVIGTAMIVGLEGLIVTIQIMRLEYYEFFTKFFGGEGIRYEPFRLE